MRVFLGIHPKNWKQGSEEIATHGVSGSVIHNSPNEELPKGLHGNDRSAKCGLGTRGNIMQPSKGRDSDPGFCVGNLEDMALSGLSWTQKECSTVPQGRPVYREGK